MTNLGTSERETLRRYETILENIHDAVYTLDADGRITWVNQTAIEEFGIGYSRDELVGAYVSKVLSQEDIERAVSIIQTLLDDEEMDSGRCEISIQTAHGDEIPCDLHLSLLLDEDGAFRGTVGILRDISDQKQREQRLAVLNRTLRHNLRNTMTLIMGRLTTLEESLDGPHDAYASDIREAAQTLLDLGEKARYIEENLDTDDHRRTPIDIAELLQERVTAFRDRYPDATFTVEGPTEYRALANDSLRLVFDELLENAIEHNTAPRRVDASVVPSPADDMVEICIRDNGPGIPQHERDALEAGTETPLQHSTGLGLWFANWLVDYYGGTLTFDTPGVEGGAIQIRLRSAPAH